MKLVLTDIVPLKRSIEIISGLVIEARFSITKEGIIFKSTDPANIAYISLNLSSKMFLKYELDKALDIGLKLSTLKDMLRKCSDTDVLTLMYENSKLIIIAKGKLYKKLEIATLEMEEKTMEDPKIEYTASITTFASLFKESIEICNIGKNCESVQLHCTEEQLAFRSDDTINTVKTIIKGDKDSIIKCTKSAKAAFSIEYLKILAEGFKLAENVRIELADEYPIKVIYKIPDKVQLWFIIAPRITNEDVK